MQLAKVNECWQKDLDYSWYTHCTIKWVPRVHRIVVTCTTAICKCTSLSYYYRSLHNVAHNPYMLKKILVGAGMWLGIDYMHIFQK